MYTLADFDFNLPTELIAQTALAKRSASRLLHVDTRSQPPTLVDRRFVELPALLEPGDLLVFNDTRVIKARFFGHKMAGAARGGKVEVLIERICGPRTALAQIRASRRPAAGTTLRLADAFDAVVVKRADLPSHPLYLLRFPYDCLTLAGRYGQLPLPPYLDRPAPQARDATRYQTVYAAHPGAVAAPTAGLHFDHALLAALDARGVQRAALTLHVGAGTFQPVRCENIAEHRMHSEWYQIPPQLVDAVAHTRAIGRRVIAVGTTSLRALEACARDAEATEAPRTHAAPNRVLRAGDAETDLFITPGYPFRVADALITNFHLPKSTLLMLVSAFAGFDAIRFAYRHAIDAHYRFFSYGDAMLLTRPHANF